MISKVSVNKITNIIFLIIITLLTYLQYNTKALLSTVILTLATIILLVRYIYLSEKINYLYILALILSWIADCFFIYERDIAAIVYILVFIIYLKILFSLTRKINSISFIIPAFLFSLVFVIFVYIMDSNDNQLIILELIYALLISCLGIFSFMYMSQNFGKGRAGYLFLFGALLLISSSAVIPLNEIFESRITSTISMVIYAIGQYLICNSMTKKSLEFKLDKKSIYESILLLLCTLSIVLISLDSFSYGIYTIPLVLIIFIVWHKGISKKTNILILIYLFLVFCAEFLLFSDIKYSAMGANWKTYANGNLVKYNYQIILVSIISQLILIYLIIKLKFINWINFLLPFLVILMSYGVLYYFKSPTRDIGSYMTFIIVIVNSFLTALAFNNYLQKMFLSNYLLLLGVIGTFLNSIIIFSSEPSPLMRTFLIFISYIAHYLICRSFMIREYRR